MATWTNDEKLEGQTSIIMESTTVIMESTTIQMDGREQTQWALDTKN